MDTLAHLLWTFIIFHNTEYLFLALFFGIMPDLFSWTVYLIYAIFKPNFREKLKNPEHLDYAPKWVFTLYGLTHSIFVFVIVFFVLLIYTQEIPIYLLPWIVHILMDIPTHSRDFLPTPFLWPLSSYRFPGFSWGVKWFMILNYALIAVLIVLVLL